MSPGTVLPGLMRPQGPQKAARSGEPLGFLPPGCLHPEQRPFGGCGAILISFSSSLASHTRGVGCPCPLFHPDSSPAYLPPPWIKWPISFSLGWDACYHDDG